MFDLDPDATADTARNLEATRGDVRLQQIRERILQAVSRVMETWSQDAEMATVSGFLLDSTSSQLIQFYPIRSSARLPKPSLHHHLCRR